MYSLPAFPTVFSPGQSGSGGHIIFDEDFLRGGKGTTIASKFATTADAAEWLQVVDNSGTVVISDYNSGLGVGGAIEINPGTGALDFVSLQLNGESFAVRNNKKMWGYVRFALDDADDAMWFVGLATTDVTGSTRGPILDGTNDSIGFTNLVGTTADIYYNVEDDTTATVTDTGFDLENSVYVDVAWYLNGRSYIEFSVNGNKQIGGTGAKMRTATNIPDNAAPLTPTIEISSTTGTTATKMFVDRICVISER